MTFTLPSPPSTNNLFVNRKDGGRAKSAGYLKWIRHAGLMLLAQRIRPIVGNYALSIRVASKRRADVDNLGKAISDLLVAHKITPDDRSMWKIEILRDPAVEPGSCTVAVYPIDIAELVAA
jgi:Holliday junction resolvase RusA-like endonuclease